MKINKVKLEEFLDEDLKKIINKHKKSKSTKILENIIDNNSENEPNIEISVIKNKEIKSLRISIEVFSDGEILNFDLDLDKDTVMELVKELD
jgi:hypothetical protein